MSTISGVSGTSSAWSATASSRANTMRDKMFAKVDSDGSGSVDKTELQAMLDPIGGSTGTSAGNASDLMSKMDSDGSGSLSQSELEAGMKNLMPPPASTIDFAQQHGGSSDDLFSKVDSDGSGSISSSELNQLLDKMASDGGASTSSTGSSSDGNSVAAKADAAVFKALDTNNDGSISASEFKAATAGNGSTAGASGPPPGGGMPPPPPSADASSSSASSSSTSAKSTDPLDTNQDGVVSAQERAAGALKDLMKAMDSNGDGSVSKSEFGSFLSQLQSAAGNSSSSQGGDSTSPSGNSSDTAAPERGRFRLSALRELVRHAYAEAQNDAQSGSLSVAA